MHVNSAGSAVKRRSRGGFVISQHDSPVHALPDPIPGSASKTQSAASNQWRPQQSSAASAGSGNTTHQPPYTPQPGAASRVRNVLQRLRSGAFTGGQKAVPWQVTKVPPTSASSRSLLPPQLRQASSGGESASLSGFGNFGNTCYMNSVLVCLMALPPFLRCLLCDSTQHALQASPYNRVPLSMELGKLLLAQLAQQVLASRSSGAGAPAPQRAELVKDTLSAACKRFQGYHQQDAHEFLIDLLGQLDTELAPLGRRLAETATILRAAYMPSDPQEHAQHVALRGSALGEGTPAYPLSVPGAHLPNSRHSRSLQRAAMNPIRRCFVFHTSSSMACTACGYSRSRVSEHVCLSLTLSEPAAPPDTPLATASGRLSPVAEGNEALGGHNAAVIDLDSDGDAQLASAQGGAGGVSAASSLQFDTPVSSSAPPPDARW